MHRELSISRNVLLFNFGVIGDTTCAQGPHRAIWTQCGSPCVNLHLHRRGSPLRLPATPYIDILAPVKFKSACLFVTGVSQSSEPLILPNPLAD